MDAHIIIMHLKELFDARSRIERHETFKELLHCKMAEGSSMNTHVLRIIGYFKKLGQLGFVMYNKLNIYLILQFKYKSLLGASRMTRKIVIIVAMRAIIGELNRTTKINLQQ